MVSSKVYPALVKELPQGDGKVFVITGTTSGTGYFAARTVAAKGGTAVLLNRPSQRATDALTKLQSEVPGATFVPIDCDLQSFDSVRKAISEIKSKYTKIYCLANNAGIMATPDEATVDGYDTQMQTNHLSHFLLTAELLPLLEAYAKENGDARVVNHSSIGRLGTKNKCLEKPYLEKNGGNLGGNSVTAMGGGACYERYYQTKLANSVFTYGLHNVLKEKGSKVKSIAAHPGVSSTSLATHLVQGCFGQFMVNRILTPLFFQSAEDGAAGLLYGMMHPKAESGILYGPAKDGFRGPAVPNHPPRDYEVDPDSIEMLWSTSEAATGAKLE